MNRHSKIIVHTPKLRPAEVSRRMPQTTPRSTRVSKSGNENSITSATPPSTLVAGSPKMIVRESRKNIVTKKKRPNGMPESKTHIGVAEEDLSETRDRLNSSEARQKQLQKEEEEVQLQNPDRISDLKKQVSVVQNDLSETRKKLNSPEAWKKQLQKKEEEEVKLHAVMTTSLIGSQHQPSDFPAAEEARLQKLCDTSHESDRAWQSTLHAILKQNTASSAFLSSTMDEIETLKMQLAMVLKLKAANLKQSELAGTEIRGLKRDMSVPLSTIENLKIHGNDSNKAEVSATIFDEIQEERLEISKVTSVTHSSGVKHRDPLSASTSILEEYRYVLNYLKREDLHMDDCAEKTEHNKLRTIRPSSLEMEVEQLRSAIEVAEIKFQEEEILKLIQIQSIYEFMESIKSDSGSKVSHLKLELKNAESEIMQLKANLVNEKSACYIVMEINRELSEEIGVPAQLQHELVPELIKSIANVNELKARLVDKEKRLQSALEENEILKNEISKRERENHRGHEAAIAELEMVKARKQDVMSMITSATKETDNSNGRAMKIAAQLTASQAVRLEMDAELSKLRIQSDQWRKAAEAAATAVVTAPDNGRFDSMGSSDSDFDLSTAGKFMNSPLSDDLDGESPTRKSISVMKKIGGLWKRSPKKTSREQYG